MYNPKNGFGVLFNLDGWIWPFGGVFGHLVDFYLGGIIFYLQLGFWGLDLGNQADQG